MSDDPTDLAQFFVCSGHRFSDNFLTNALLIGGSCFRNTARDLGSAFFRGDGEALDFSISLLDAVIQIIPRRLLSLRVIGPVKRTSAVTKFTWMSSGWGWARGPVIPRLSRRSSSYSKSILYLAAASNTRSICAARACSVSESILVKSCWEPRPLRRSLSTSAACRKRVCGETDGASETPSSDGRRTVGRSWPDFCPRSSPGRDRASAPSCADAPSGCWSAR
jgi:hypothetical protein